MDFLLANWGNLASSAGLIVSLVGFVWAIRRAGQARTSARAAEDASVRTQEAFRRSLSADDLGRAIELIQRLKDAHGRRQWDVTLELYYHVQTLLEDIRLALPAGNDLFRSDLEEAIRQLREIENIIRSGPREGLERSVEELNSIQGNLRGQAAKMRMPIVV